MTAYELFKRVYTHYMGQFMGHLWANTTDGTICQLLKLSCPVPKLISLSVNKPLLMLSRGNYGVRGSYQLPQIVY